MIGSVVTATLVGSLAVSSVAGADITMMDGKPAPGTGVVALSPAIGPTTGTVVVTNDGGNQVGDEVVYDDWNERAFESGAILFLASWGASAIIGGTDDHVGANRLYVPVAGPWLALNDWGHCPINNPQCDSNTTDKFLLIADGVIQAGAVLTMAEALVFPTSHARHAVVADKKLHVTPTGTGISMYGHF